MKNRKGKFIIDGKLYDDEAENVQKALSCIGFLPYRVEYLALEDKFELIGCAVDFNDLKEGLLIPEYILTIEVDDDGIFQSASALAL